MPKLVGTQSGEVVVPVFHWKATFSACLIKLKNIKKFHYLEFNTATPEYVSYRLQSDTDKESISLLLGGSWCPSSTELYYNE